MLDGAAARAVFQAEDAIQLLQWRYDALASEWKRWAEYRDYYVKEVVATVPVAPTAAEVPVASPTLAQVFAEPSVVVEPVVAADPAVVAEPAPTPAPTVTSPAIASQAAHGTKPARERRGSAAFEALTAPALLGVAGAALLVAAAIVFVALAWTSFSPVARGSVVLAVGLLVAGISVWVKRLGLVASSGAIGVVAMGFAGVATIAYLRDSGVVGSFDAAAALLVAGIAGLVLSRFGIPWVGSAAALSMAASVASFTFAATATADRAAEEGASVGAMPIWIVAGTGAASALAASHRLWRWTVAKSVVAWASVVWLTVVGISVPVWIWGGDGGVLEAALGLLPVLALAVIASRWQLLATGPAAFLFSVMVPALAAALGASVWAQAAASAAAVTATLALGRWLPRRVLRPLFIGVAPAYVVVAVASAGYAFTITVGRIVAGTYVPDTQLWAGVAALLCGLAIATLRQWRLEWTVLRVATPVGAAMVAVGAGIAAFGIAELTGPPAYHSSVAIALVVAAIGLMAMTRVWWEAAARVVTELGILAFLLTAAVHAYWALVISEFVLVVSLAVVLAPLAVFALRARTAPWWSIPFLSAGVTALAPALAARYAVEVPALGFALVASACAVAWTAWRLPRALHPHVASGLVPALVVGGMGAVASAVSTVQTLVSSSVEEGRSAWWDAAALALALALATWHRWQLPALAHRAVPIAGAAVVLVSGAGFAVSAAGAWGGGLEGSVPLWILIGALAVLPFTALWGERTAAWVNGIGSASLATLAGANALGYVAVPSNSVWLPLCVALGAIAVLGISSVRWPTVALAPAVALSTGLGLVLALRADAGVAIAVAIAAGVGAVAVWLPLPGVRRPLAAFGALPALLGGAIVSIAGVVTAVLELAFVAPGDEVAYLGWFTLVAQGALGLALCAVPRTLAQWERAGHGHEWHAENLRGAMWGLLATAFAAMVSVTAIATKLPWIDFSVAAIARTVTASAAAVIVAAAYAVVRRTALTGKLARRAARIGGAAWVGAAGVLAGFDAWMSHITWWAGAVALGIALVTLCVWSLRWRRSGIAALTVAVTSAPLVLAASHVVTTAWGVAIGAAIGAGIAWTTASARWARILPPSAVALGLIPIALVTIPVAVASALLGVKALFEHALGTYSPSVDGWLSATLVAVVLGLLAEPRARLFVAPVLATTAVLAIGGFGATAAVLVLVGALAFSLWLRGRARFTAKAAAIAAAGALAWALGDWLLVALASSAIAVSGGVVLRRGPAKPRVVVAGTPVFAGLAVFAGAMAPDAPWATWLAAPAAMAAIVAMAALMWREAPSLARSVVPWVLIAATVVVPVVADALAAAGTSLLVAAVGWFALATTGHAEARWYAALAASVGVGLIAYDAGATAIEAYTLAPAACALALGVAWMRSSPSTSSIAALSPGLAIALVPSYLALVANPDNLARTAWLTCVMVALALVGMNRRWFAPVAATAVTAILVAVLQVVVGTNLVFRLISFLIVGTLLLVAASWFDKIKSLR